MAFTIKTMAKSQFFSMKTEIVDYYNTFYEHKAAAPICIALCIVIIAAYVGSHAGMI